MKKWDEKEKCKRGSLPCKERWLGFEGKRWLVQHITGWCT